MGLKRENEARMTRLGQIYPRSMYWITIYRYIPNKEEVSEHRNYKIEALPISKEITVFFTRQNLESIFSPPTIQVEYMKVN